MKEKIILGLTSLAVFLFIAFTNPRYEETGLYEVHSEITDIEDNMQVILENWDTGSRKDPLKDITKEVDRLIKANYKLGKLIKEK